MNTKDVLALVDRKYKFIKEEAVKEIDKKIEEAKQEKENIIKKINNDLKTIAMQMSEAQGLVVDNEKNLISYNSYYVSYHKMEELYDEKKEIEKSVEKDRIEFVDEIIVLGIKDEMVKEKIKQLLNVK